MFFTIRPYFIQIKSLIYTFIPQEMKKLFFLIAICLLCLNLVGQNADSIWFADNYTKMEQQIPMRDGIKLFTSIYIPKDNSEDHPILMTRTPYSCAPYGEDKWKCSGNLI